MSFNIHLEIDGIKGESMVDRYKDQIDVLSWAWGVTNSASITGGGGGVGKPQFQDFSFTHRYDKASPLLMLACASGKHIRKAVLHELKTGATPVEFLTLTFEELLITAAQPHDDGTGPQETITLTAAKVHASYRAQKADGSLDAAITVGWDVKLNQSI
jgi:type VI secretion system secreted protein Hcp